MSSPYTLVPHPLVAAKLTQLRDATTSPKDFRQLVKELTTIIGLEASRTLALKDVPGVSCCYRARTWRSVWGR
jgi:uracil phosphoribosyltransferase